MHDGSHSFLQPQSFILSGTSNELKAHLETAAQIVFNLTLKVPLELWPTDHSIYAVDADKSG